MSVGTPPRLWMMGREAAIVVVRRAPTECTMISGGRAVTGPRTEYLAYLKPAAVVGKSLACGDKMSYICQ